MNFNIRLFLGALLLLTGIAGLYLSTTLPIVNLSDPSLIYVFSEVKRNRMIMSIAIMIAGLVIIIDQKKAIEKLEAL